LETIKMAVRWPSAVALLLLFFAVAPVGAQTPVSAQDPPLPPGVIYAGEYKNYLAAINTPDPAARAQAIDIWLTWYPNSVLRSGAFEAGMAAWQSAGSPAKADAVAARLLQIEPDNVRALANRAYSGRARAMAGEADALAPAVAAAQRGIGALPKWQKPANMSDPDFTRLKMQIVAILDGTLGYAALQTKDYSKARAHFLEAVTVEPDNLQDCYQLSVALLEGQPTDPLGFWYAARAITLARAAKNEPVADSIEKYAHAWYRHYHGSDEGWDKLQARVVSASEAVPPENVGSTISRKMTASETAMQVAAGADPGALSFAEWELVLAHRDDTPENKIAADKVWRAIGERQRGGARLKLPVKVIAVSPDRIEAALAEDKQASGTADIEIRMAHELRPLPAVGSTISIIGALTDYRPRPFLFTLTNAELAEESMPVAGGACAEPRPQMCTRDYRPACGIRKDGGRKTYGNACSACADAEIVTQNAGACP
jgi:tetratricopeptide (TPR) repeat protein